VSTRKAWELLSLVDQIHLWGATDFRNSIIKYLKQWHEFGRRCYANDVDFLFSKLKTDRVPQDRKGYCCVPAASLQLPDWANRLSEEIRGKLLERAGFHFREAYRRDLSALSDQWPAAMKCVRGDCGPLGTPGYPIRSEEEMVAHYCLIHGTDDETIADLVRVCREAQVFDNDNNPLQVRKRKRSESREPGPCTKQLTSAM
jgi:hypothetical protein